MSESTEEAVADRPEGGGGHEVSAHDEEHRDQTEYPYVQHHYDNPAQQLEAGKLGIWLFLVTEILFFGGLFCAYTVYRAKYPEVFYWGHFYLDKELGTANTILLILSSLTAAWAVKNAQLGQQKQLVTNIVITIACACTFLGIKYVEYSHKYHDGLLPGPAFDPKHELWENETFQAKFPESAKAIEKLQSELKLHRAKLAQAAVAALAKPAGDAAGSTSPGTANEPGASAASAVAEGKAAEGKAPEDKAAEGKAPEDKAAEGKAAEGKAAEDKAAEGKAAEGKAALDEVAEVEAAAAPESEATPQAGTQVPDEGEAKPAEPEGTDGAAVAAKDAPGAEENAKPATDSTAVAADAAPAAEQPVSEAIFLANAIRKLPARVAQPLIDAGVIRPEAEGAGQLQRPERAHMFFSVYFFMTGLHGFHVLVGIIIWVWLLVRATRGQFGPLFFGPIDFAALYWHLVDMIWIYLFPLLYLIH